MADIREKPIDMSADRSLKDVESEVCLCGNETFRIVAKFRNGKIVAYFTEGACFDCGRWLKMPAPTEEDTSFATD